ncbi:MAG: OmpH family outer membrane protein [Pirellulales bacterium]
MSSVAVFAALSPLFAVAQAPAAAAAPSASVGHNIAIVDVGVIFTGCTRYKQAIETLKTQTIALENQFKAEYEGMKKVADEMKVMQPGSPEFRAKESELAKKELDFKYRQAQERKNFEEKVNGVQFALYREIDAVVKQIRHAQ